MAGKRINVYNVRLPGWGADIQVRGYDEADAIGFARLNFKCKSDDGITATFSHEFLTAGELAELRSRIISTPAPAPEFPRAKKGPKPLNISVETICDALRLTRDIHAAARACKCSRGYIYKVLGVEAVRDAVKAGRE